MSPDRLGIARKNLRTAIFALSLLIAPAFLYANVAQADDDAEQINAAAAQLLNQGNFAAAIPLYQRALELAPQSLGPDNLDTAVFANNLAICYEKLGEYAKAVPHYQRALKIREKAQGADGPLVADTLNNLALVYRNMGEPSKAKPIYERSLKIYAALNGQGDPTVAMVMNNLGIVEEDLGEYAKAETLFQNAFAIRATSNLPLDGAQSETNLANLYRTVGEYSLAEPYLQQSLHTYVGLRGPDHPDVANVLISLGNLYYVTGRYARAEPLYQQALKIYESTYGPNHPLVAVALGDLGLLYAASGKYTEALPYYERCEKISEAVLGPDHPQVGAAINNLGMLFADMGQPAKAETLYLRSLKIRQSRLGTDNPQVAASLANLGVLYESIGQPDKAEPLFRRSLAIDVARLGPNDLDVARYPLHDLAMLHAAEARWNDASDEFDRSRRIIRRGMARNLLFLSDIEQLVFLDQDDQMQFQIALSLGLRRRNDEATAERSAAWLINGKSVAQEALTRTRRTRKAVANDPDFAEQIRQAKLARERLAEADEEDADRRRNDAEVLATWEDLQTAFPAMKARDAIQPDLWVEPADVQKSMSGDTVLIDIARFGVWDFGGRGKNAHRRPDHYVAWILPAAGQGAIQIVDLGDAGKIDAAIQAARLEFESPRTMLVGEAAHAARSPSQVAVASQSPTPKSAARGLDLGPLGDESSTAAMQALAKLTLDPLQPFIGQAKQLIISPDSALWLVSWEALPLPDGKYAIERYRISYVISGRELVRPKDKSIHTPAPTAPVVFANPDYNLSPEEVVARTSDVLRDAAQEASGLLPLNNVPDAIAKVARLPGTAAEAKAIEPKLKDYCHADPIAYTDMYALKGVFQQLNSPRVVVLSTHGFALSDQVAAQVHENSAGLSEDRSANVALTRDGQPLQDPMLRCGLLLAGCNQRVDRTVNPNADNGILTGSEIADTDLRGTELVVLSACDTGLGQIHNGEGVAGLRQAFQLAGAKAVVATLWEIPDQETATLMSDFFSNLAAGQGKTDALRSAQLNFIKARREKYGSAPPFYWAAFTLTGQN